MDGFDGLELIYNAFGVAVCGVYYNGVDAGFYKRCYTI
jgi:hypothetical protein